MPKKKKGGNQKVKGKTPDGTNIASLPIFQRSKDFTPRFTALVQEGASFESACEELGISKTSYMRWQRKAKQGEEPYLSFMVEVTKSRAKFRNTLVSKIVQHLDDPRNARAGIELLGRMFPEFSEKRKVEVEQDRNYNIIVNSKTHEEVAKEQELQRKKREALEGEVVE